ncbi:MAG: bifunctional oligoribonuclease/PAP phosphatase NrnA [Halobacteriales archaeon]
MAQVPGAEPAGDAVNRLVTAVTSDPRLAAAVVLIATALVLLLLVLVRRRFRTKGGELKRTLGQVDDVTVLTHPNPDPDAMATAIGVARMAELADTGTSIRFPGQIRHQENRAFRTVLDLDLEPLDSADDLGPEPVVLVDHNEPRGFEGADQIEPYAVVDHHPGDGTGSDFTDVRKEYGAAASIVTEYFREIGARPGQDDPATGKLNTTVATGLLYGILADTAHLTRGCTRAEFEAAAFLHPAIEEDAIDRIANPQVDQEILEVISRAISDRDVRPPYAIADVGELSNLDAIPQAADELLSLEGVSAVVVMGEKEDTLHLSGRSRDDRVHMGNALQTVVSEIPLAEAGGHARMGGGQISIEQMEEGYGPNTGLTRQELHQRLFDVLAGDV